MFKKILFLMLFVCWTFALNLQTASKNELMSIKGIGEKRAESIIKYRKIHHIKSIDDLKNINGIGNSVIYNVKHNVRNKNSSKASKTIKRKVKSKKKIETKPKKKKIRKTTKIKKKKKSKKIHKPKSKKNKKK